LDTRIGVVGIVIRDPMQDAKAVNDILSEFSPIIVGRMGIPYRERSISVIALTVDGSNDRIGAMTGKIGLLKSVTVKSALAPSEVTDGK